MTTACALGSDRDPVLDLRRLSVEFGTSEAARTRAVEDASFEIRAGETLALVGESGSGKSVTSLSILRLTDRTGGRIASGEILFRRSSGEVVDLAKAPEAELRRVRGAEIAMIFQEPMTSLNPVMSVGEQIAETLEVHSNLSRADARREAVRLLERVRIPDAERVARRSPQLLSGGMRQRAMIAMALACRPRLLIADEPTTALDVTVQAEILELIRELQREDGTAVLFITHDMGVVAEIADRVTVMRKGRIVETKPVEALFKSPEAPYTRALLSAVPKPGECAASDDPAPFRLCDPETGAALPPPVRTNTAPGGMLLEARGLTKTFPAATNLFGRVTHRLFAMNDVSFTIREGETLALVGESGCGKSTTGRVLAGLLSPDAGDVVMEGRRFSELSGADLRRARSRLQMIFQDPYASLDPRRTAGEAVEEPLEIHTTMTARERRTRAAQLFERVGLPASALTRFPHEFSGGQRQRICIARALALEPRLIVADESVAALDVSIRARIANLLMELQAELGLAILFISHDMSIVERMSHRVAVMRAGEIVEMASRRELFANPHHPYTKRLLSAVPIPDPTVRRTLAPDPVEVHSAVRAAADRPHPVRYDEVAGGHFVACAA